MLIGTFDRKAERSDEVLLISDHHVNALRNFQVDLLRGRLAPAVVPQTGSIVQVIGHDRSVPPRRLHRGERCLGTRLAQTRTTSPGVQPAPAQVTTQAPPR